MAYLLDTNVVSEAIRPRPHPAVIAWLQTQPLATIYLSVLTLGEIEQGIVRAPDPQRAARLQVWLDHDLLPRFEGRILNVDRRVMKTWGQVTGRALLHGRPVSYLDSLLASTAIVHGLTLATRTSRDVAALPVQTVNPWEIE